MRFRKEIQAVLWHLITRGLRRVPSDFVPMRWMFLHASNPASAQVSAKA
jgi:hypothetical protein